SGWSTSQRWICESVTIKAYPFQRRTGTIRSDFSHNGCKIPPARIESCGARYPPDAFRPTRVRLTQGALEAELAEIAELEAFVTVVRLESFSRAARELGRTQSTVSRQVQRLVQEYGERLMNRSPAGFGVA